MDINGRNTRDFTDIEIDYLIGDISNAIEAQERMRDAGFRTDKLEHYADELLALGQEKNRRSSQGLVRITMKENDASAIIAVLNAYLTGATCDMDDEEKALRGCREMAEALGIDI